MSDDAVPDLFGGQPVPSREEYVLAQGFRRKPSYCMSMLPDERMWPVELDAASDYSANTVFIDRNLVFAVAQRVVGDLNDPWAAPQLHAAITFWGAPPGQSTSRAVKPLAADHVSERLTAAIKLVRGEGARSAYKALGRRQRLWVSGLGPSYFTKLLYFAGYGAKPFMPQPLIMDDNVINGLTATTGRPWQATADDYLAYLDLAKDWAVELETEPDVIERRLFALGS
jgi:hypothetical protein